MKTPIRPFILAASFCASFPLLAQSQQTGDPETRIARQGPTTPGDGAFLTQAIQGDLAEIQLGQLAQQNAASDEVREFGRRMVEDHTESMNKATQAAQSQGAEVPSDPAPEAQQKYRELARLSGEEFDREFMRHMVEDHEKHVRMFEQTAEEGDSEAAQHAEETLPVLEEHLQLAETLQQETRG